MVYNIYISYKIGVCYVFELITFVTTLLLI